MKRVQFKHGKGKNGHNWPKFLGCAECVFRLLLVMWNEAKFEKLGSHALAKKLCEAMGKNPDDASEIRSAARVICETAKRTSSIEKLPGPGNFPAYALTKDGARSMFDAGIISETDFRKWTPGQQGAAETAEAKPAPTNGGADAPVASASGASFTQVINDLVALKELDRQREKIFDRYGGKNKLAEFEQALKKLLT